MTDLADELTLYLELDNRRGGERTATQMLPIELLVEGQPARILNISASGIRYIVKEKKDFDTVDIDLKCNERHFELRGKRAWGERVGPGHFAVGLSFEASDELQEFQTLLSGGTIRGADPKYSEPF